MVVVIYLFTVLSVGLIGFGSYRFVVNLREIRRRRLPSEYAEHNHVDIDLTPRAPATGNEPEPR